MSCSSVLPVPDAVSGKIEIIGEEYGNIDTTLTQTDLDKLDLKVGDDFALTHNTTTVTVHLGKTYEDVEKGEWVSFLNWEDKLRLARSFANASETLKAEVGDDITIRKAK